MNTAKSSLIRTNLSVWVTTEDEEIQSSTLQIDLYPRFYAPVEIHMPDDQNDVVLNIIGTSEVLNQLTVEYSIVIYVGFDLISISIQGESCGRENGVHYQWCTKQ